MLLGHLAAVERADVVILILTATEELSDQDEKIIGYAHEMKKAILVIVNKWDLIEKDTKTMLEFKQRIQAGLNFMTYAPYLFISAKTGQRVNKVLSTVKECYDNYSKRIATGILNEVVNKAVLMREPGTVANKRLKIFYGTQVDTKPPTFVFFVNNANLLHFSYQRYLENQLRSSFEFSGTGIKLIFRERKV